MDVNYAAQPDDMIMGDESAFIGLFPISRQNSCTFSLPETFSRQYSLQIQEVPCQPPNDCYAQTIESKGVEQYNEGVETAFSGLFPISRQNSCTLSLPETFSYQNSLKVSPSNCLKVSQSNCYCGGDTCKQIYTRQSKYPRIIEPCSKLFKYGFDKKVQIRIPNELQTHIGYGSCKHCYKALVTLITYVQVQCGFRVRHNVIQTFCAPTKQDIVHAQHVIEGFGLPVNFYVNTWASSFQGRFVAACDGIVHVQAAMHRFFGTGDESETSDEPEADNDTTSDTDDGFLDTAIAMLQEVTPPRSEPRANASYIERIEAILENDSNTSVHKLSLCNAVLYECLSKQDNAHVLSV